MGFVYKLLISKINGNDGSSPYSPCFFLLNVLQLPKGRDVEDDDSFTFNDSFTAPLYRIKVHGFVPPIVKDYWCNQKASSLHKH